MPYNADGTWKDGGNDTVASRVAQLQSQDSALMRGAIASGMNAASRRGMVNSSMGIGAGVQAGLGAVTPIASADASNELNKSISNANLASNEKTAYANAMANATSNYQVAMSNTLQNSDIPASTRSSVQSDLANIYRTSQQNLANIYGAKLSWG